MPTTLPATDELLECDLVMKGGITSGIVYPPVVAELAQRYRFRSIGGTSAGAIAAAVTAAAEYGRASGGFNRLRAMVEQQLKQPGFIANLFQPTPAARPVLSALFRSLALERQRKQTGAAPSTLTRTTDTLAILGAFSAASPASNAAGIGALIGLLIGVGWLLAALFSGGLAWLLTVVTLLLTLLGWWAGRLLGAALTLLNGLPETDYGACSGMPVAGHATTTPIADGTGQYAALTEWLSGTIDALAGLTAGPLTVGQLEHNHQPMVDERWRIQLNMVTTNLSQGEPYTFPFDDRELPFLWSEQEFRRLFPKYVVEYLIGLTVAARGFQIPVTITDERGAPQTLRFLPPAAQLPVILGTRMSLSYPVLLSAVPLWTIGRAAYTEMGVATLRTTPFALETRHVQRNWFSDGGICSNFPIHFYDKWFPTRPTFGINLDELPERGAQVEVGFAPGGGHAETATLRDEQGYRVGTLQPAGDQSAAAVSLPSSYPAAQPRPQWKAIDGGVFGFVGAVVNTGLFYRDTMQGRLTSYYDRIVTVRLRPDEGGMNLDMPAATIAAIANKGTLAGQTILNQFDFTHHRWVRLLLLLAEMEEQLLEIHAAVLPPHQPLTFAELAEPLRALQAALDHHGLDTNAVRSLLATATAAVPAFPYPRDAAWDAESAPRFLLLLLLIELWGQPGARFFSRTAEPEQPIDTRHILLRVTPDL